MTLPRGPFDGRTRFSWVASGRWGTGGRVRHSASGGRQGARAALRILRGLSLAIGWVTMLAPLGAADYHVSPVGDDATGSGSAGAPWRSLGHAAAMVPAGPHTIRVAAGTYRENAPIFLRPRVSVMGAGAAATLIENGYYVDGSSFDYLFRLDSAVDGVMEAGGQELSGFHIRGVDHANRTRQSGIRIRGRTDVTVRNVKLSSMAHGGMDIRAADSVPSHGPSQFLTGITVTGCEFENTAGRLGDASYGNLMIGGVEGGEFSHLRITESLGAGIRDWTGGWWRNTKIHHCVIDMMPPDRTALIPGDQSPAIQVTQVSGACEIHHCELNHWLVLTHAEAPVGAGWNLRIHANTFRSDHLFVGRPDGQPFRVANHGMPGVEISGNYFADLTRAFAIWNGPQQGAIDRLSIHHNVFEGVGEAPNGIHIQPQKARDMAGITVAHNTFLDLQRAVFVEPMDGRRALGVEIANNLCLDRDPPPFHLTPQIDLQSPAGALEGGFVRNTLFHGIETAKGVLVSGPSTLDPMAASHIHRFAGAPAAEPFPLVANGARPIPYFHLRPPGPGSPNSAVDAGVVLPGLNDNASGPPDIGAFERLPVAALGPDGVAIQRDGDRLTLRWASTAGSSYWIETSTGLASGSWSTVAGPLAADPAATDTSFALSPADAAGAFRFFRVRKSP